METTNKLSKRFKRKWLEALRSEMYKQTIGRLRNNASSTYCCLGVLCEVIKIPLNPDGSDIAESKYGTGYKVFNNFMSLEQREMLIDLNDRKKKSFKEIADYIEENL